MKGVKSNQRRGGYGISGFKSEPRQSLQERLLGLKNRHKLQQILKSRQSVKGLQGNQSGDHGSYNNGRIENSSRRKQYQGKERQQLNVDIRIVDSKNFLGFGRRNSQSQRLPWRRSIFG